VWIDICGITVAAGATVFLRAGQCQHGCAQCRWPAGFSANDWLVPMLTYVLVSRYATVRPPLDRHRIEQVRRLTRPHLDVPVMARCATTGTELLSRWT